MNNPYTLDLNFRVRKIINDHFYYYNQGNNHINADKISSLYEKYLMFRIDEKLPLNIRVKYRGFKPCFKPNIDMRCIVKRVLKIQPNILVQKLSTFCPSQSSRQYFYSNNDSLGRT